MSKSSKAKTAASFMQGQSVQERQGAVYSPSGASNARPLAPIKGIDNPTADMVAGMTALRNAQNVSAQLTNYVIPRPRQPKEVYPSGTLAARGYRDAYGALHVTRGIKAKMGFPGGPETIGAQAMGHDPLDTPPTDYIQHPEGIERHYGCWDKGACQGLCGAACALTAHRAQSRGIRSDFPKTDDLMIHLGTIICMPGGRHEVVR